MVDQLRELDPATVAANLTRVREEVGPDVEILAAIKYLPTELLPALAAGGVTIVGENRAQAFQGPVARETAPDSVAGETGRWAQHRELFEHWDFIGTLQSRKVKDLLGRARYIHSLASESALAQLEKHDARGTEVFIEVNVAGDPDKSGIAPDDLPGYLERFRAVGLMTMPPHTTDPDSNRRHFAALKQLAERHGLEHLSMGTSQDYRVAAEEGATIIRLGTTLFTAS
jgi:PLP dependent protein